MDLDHERRFNALLVEGLAVSPGERRAYCDKIAHDEPELAAEVLAALDDASCLRFECHLMPSGDDGAKGGRSASP